MTIANFLLQIFAAVALLLFAVGIVRTSVESGTGRFVAAQFADRASNMRSATVGALLAIALQSSAAAALLLGGLAATGLLGFSTGFSALLGADLGSALVIQILSADLSWLMPLLLFCGGWLAIKSSRNELRTAGQVIMGLGLILLSLDLLRDAVAPLRDSGVLTALSSYFIEDRLAGFLAGAALALVLHSSVATILMCFALVQTGALSFDVALPIVLGANAGSGLLAYWLTRDLPPQARRIPAAVAIVRGVMSLACLWATSFAQVSTLLLISSPETALITTHILFNLLVLGMFIPFASRLAGPMARLMPSEDDLDADFDSPVSNVAKDESRDPEMVLSAIRQDILSMVDEVEKMYRPILHLFEQSDPAEAEAIRARDTRVNGLFTHLRRYMAQHARRDLSKKQLKESRALLDYAIRVEAAGDIVAKRLTSLAEEMHASDARFSAHGTKEIQELHALVLSGFSLARHVLLVDDIEAARRLVLDKAEVKRRERASRTAHVKRLEKRVSDSIESSDVHLETLRFLRELYGHIAAVAFPILYRNGQMLDTRLVRDNTPAVRAHNSEVTT